jgi:hypothetical protein
VLGVQGPERFDDRARQVAAPQLALAAGLLAATAGVRPWI